MDRQNDDFFARLADALAPRIAAELRGVAAWISQRDNTPLGRNTHCAAVRRRLVEAGPGAECGAAIGGTRSEPLYLLSPAALSEELHRPRGGMRKCGPDPDAAPDSHRERLLAKLRRVR